MALVKATLTLLLLALVRVEGRAVNLSSVWLLPEEGYPVFYRYFRDRITWYEADAVCQFHHGQLITVDSSSEFDAARAYLKELDVVNFVWTGLKRASSKQNFLWPESKSMENPEGHWAVDVPKMDEPLCAAIDPSSDFRWQPLPCSGPTVAAFICQMQVPIWAQKDDGCMLTSLPSLTVTFLPEQGAVELISDCGLEGTRRIACKGQANHEEMIKKLSCESTTEASTSNTWDDQQPTRHRRESEVTGYTSSPNTTQDVTSSSDDATFAITTEEISTFHETTIEEPNKNATTSPTESTGQLEVAEQIVSKPSDPQFNKRAKPIPPSLKGNSPFAGETQFPGMGKNISDETEAPPESHEILGEGGQPTRGSPEPGIGTNPSLEVYKKNIQDSGEDHTEDFSTATETEVETITSTLPVSSTPIPSHNVETTLEEHLPTPDALSDGELPERPNRGRLLVHPQHHSFYAYFLNRVLG
ncbi:uncharacterized protein LOC112127555 isoform X2 [Cimex lectularius]|uniref:C-type lectin domain-containing protein n=1 Tax=Cimex lectularius TaxID=79782 RepID=A0A8I6TML8_CIMLE|nr:uncharacterized protein LOC112127555 isoform X2 [Cimex lectularius]